MQLKWTREYYGIRHLKNIIPAYQMTLVRYTDDSNGGYVYLIYKHGKNPFTPIQDFKGTLRECEYKAHFWVAKHHLIDFDKALTWDHDHLTEEEHSDDFENIAGIDPYGMAASPEGLCLMVLTKMQNFCHVRGLKVDDLVKDSNHEFDKQRKERAIWRGTFA